MSLSQMFNGRSGEAPVIAADVMQPEVTRGVTFFLTSRTDFPAIRSSNESNFYTDPTIHAAAGYSGQ
jgi:hypothetical protein